MKRVFRFKKGDSFDGDEDCIYTIFEMLCGDSDTVKRNTKITIVSEQIKKTKLNSVIRDLPVPKQ